MTERQLLFLLVGIFFLVGAISSQADQIAGYGTTAPIPIACSFLRCWLRLAHAYLRQSGKKFEVAHYPDPCFHVAPP